MASFKTYGRRLPSTGGVYLLIHESTGQWYVGSSRNVRMRLRMHKTRAFYDRRKRPLIARLIASYGPETFRVRVLESVADPAQLRNRESWWLRGLLSFDLGGNLNQRDFPAPEGY